MIERATTGRVRFSIMLPTFVDAGSANPYRPTFEFARRVDELGYYMGTLGHHSFGPEIGDPSAPFTLLGAIAAHTNRLRLGTGVYLAPLHHPITVAEQTATLDQVSGGRAGRHPSCRRAWRRLVRASPGLPGRDAISGGNLS